MARLAVRVTTERVEALLAYLRLEWESVPDLEERWPTMAEEDREDDWREWGIRDDALREVVEASNADTLNAGQCAELAHILALTKLHRATIDQLFGA